MGNQKQSASFKEVIQALLKKNMLVAFLMGFSSGLPLLLTLKTLQAWMVDEGVNLKVIGVFALAGLPYTWKFVWSPLLDRFTLPFLGRRRGWMLVSQILLFIFIMAIGLLNPKEHTWWVALFAVFISFFSATQDILIDAYRREDLSDKELGMGSTLYVYGYRVALLVSGAFALVLSEYMSWMSVYFIMASFMGVGIFTTLWCQEPELKVDAPKTLKDAVVLPFFEFLKRKGAIEILIFILLFKLGDTIAGNMSTPFYLLIGYSKTQVAAIAKTFGFFSTISGAFIGGLLILKMGIHRSLWICGFLQALSTFFFSILAQIPTSSWALAGVIGFEDFSGGMGTAALVAYMATQTDKRFTATQYALLTSIMGIPRVLISAPSGYLAELLGWSSFFIFCALIAIPGILLLLRLAPWNEKHS